MAAPSPAGPARPLYFVYGADGFRVRLRARELVAALTRGEAPLGEVGDVRRAGGTDDGANVTRLSARSATPAEILVAARTEGLFAAVEDRRVIVVEDAAELRDGLFLRDFPDDVALVLVAPGPIERSRQAVNESGGAAGIERAVRELGGRTEEFAPLEEVEVEAWLSRRAAALGLELAPDARVELARGVGADLERAEHELSKLAAHAGDGQINVADVRALVPGAVESDVFVLAGAVARRDVRTAVEMLERLMDEGEPPQRLLGLLVWQFRVLLAASGARTESDVDRAAAEMKLSRGAILRARRAAPLASRAAILKAYESLYAADVAMKTGRLDPRTGLLLAVLELCGVPGTDLGPLAERPL